MTLVFALFFPLCLRFSPVVRTLAGAFVFVPAFFVLGSRAVDCSAVGGFLFFPFFIVFVVPPRRFLRDRGGFFPLLCGA